MKNLQRGGACHGFTLTELLIVLAIAAIVLGQVVPGIGSLATNSRKQSAVSDLIALINLARNTAAHEQTAVTLCPLDPNNKCIADWSLPLTAFRDPSRSKTLTAETQIIRVSNGWALGHLTVKSSNRPYFRFRPSGMALEAIGNITWCPPDNDARNAEQIRINMGGRPSLAIDSNGDGIVEGTDGKPVSC